MRAPGSWQRQSAQWSRGVREAADVANYSNRKTKLQKPFHGTWLQITTENSADDLSHDTGQDYWAGECVDIFEIRK